MFLLFKSKPNTEVAQEGVSKATVFQCPTIACASPRMLTGTPSIYTVLQNSQCTFSSDTTQKTKTKVLTNIIYNSVVKAWGKRASAC